MSYNNGKTSKEIWAVMDELGEVMWTRGGSSTAPRLMVYESEAKALRAWNNPWIKQVHKDAKCIIRRVYPV